MAAQSTSKRPVCPSCSKPTRLCLCSRFQTPGLQNSVRVTILQHSLEKKHPLNSARIARLGLKNLTVATVCDVIFEARFVIRLLELDTHTGSVGKDTECPSLCRFHCVSESVNFDQISENINGSNSGSGDLGNMEIEPFLEYPEEKITKIVDNIVECNLSDEPKAMAIGQSQCEGRDFAQSLDNSAHDVLVLEPEHKSAIKECDDAENTFVNQSYSTSSEAISDDKDGVINGEKLSQDNVGAFPRDIRVPVITATIGKRGFDSGLTHYWMPGTHWQKPDFDVLLAFPGAVSDLAKGFVVKKSQKRQLKGSTELEEYEEFEIEVPPGSVLLFPSEKAIGVEGLEAINFEVKNLIVLDGTWAKARRMYYENPWLKLLPHLKLDPNTLSLYSEVRQQPKAGYLSTIESIVLALKAVGNNPEGLDNLLDVFESMVADQRRCKDERLCKVSLV
ncbi:hypothetical protein L1049_001314 [Liquidambar formosana]|uniref:tRNA-uridine aminocarboxypropyltransferase n=1 Tax=Liquidambar formosana TaxID=63359 RepID=A0AAP0NAD5_LIQFO